LTSIALGVESATSYSPLQLTLVEIKPRIIREFCFICTLWGIGFCLCICNAYQGISKSPRAEMWIGLSVYFF